MLTRLKKSKYRWMSWLCRMFPHVWEDVGYNRWYIPIERRCLNCGSYSHTLWEDYRGIDLEPIWRKGKHPSSLIY